MSLTRFLDNKEVKEKFKEYLNKPKIKYSKEVKVPYKSNHYTQIGVAFDYLMQLYLKRLNPDVKDNVKFLVKENIPSYSGEIKRNALANYSLLEESLYKFFKIQGLQTELIINLLNIAPYDIAYRTGMYQYLEDEFNPEPDDILIIKEMYKLLKSQNFKNLNKLILNSDFGIFNKYVGGADIDLIVDDAIIDIKTTMQKGFPRKDFNQVFGYYLLYQLSSMKNEKGKEHKIKNIGVYKARYGETILCPIKDIITEEKLNELIDWFVIKIGEFYNHDQEMVNDILKFTTNYNFTI